MNKEKYIPWEMEVLHFGENDIINTSLPRDDDETIMIAP